MARSGATLSLNILQRKNATSITLSPERLLHFEPTRTLAAEVKKRAGLREPLRPLVANRADRGTLPRLRYVNWLPRRMHDALPFAGHALDATWSATPSRVLKTKRARVRVKKLAGCDPVNTRRGETVTLQATNEERSPVLAAG